MGRVLNVHSWAVARFPFGWFSVIGKLQRAALRSEYRRASLVGEAASSVHTFSGSLAQMCL